MRRDYQKIETGEPYYDHEGERVIVPRVALANTVTVDVPAIGKAVELDRDDVEDHLEAEAGGLERISRETLAEVATDDELAYFDDVLGDDVDDEDPVASPAGYEYESERNGTIDRWTHRETGLTVTVRKNARPDQMHTPETSQRMEGYEAQVRGGPDDVAEPLSANDLGHQGPQRRTAAEFMHKYPDGEYVPELRVGWEFGRVHWRDDDVEDDGGNR